MSRRSCLSISALIRFDSFASSLRQQAIMDSRVIPPLSCGSPDQTGPDEHWLTGFRFSRIPGPRLALKQARRRRSVGLDWTGRTDGWMDGRGWGRGDLAKGPRCQVVPPAGKKRDFTRMFHRKSREIHTGKGSKFSPDCTALNTA